MASNRLYPIPLKALPGDVFGHLVVVRELDPIVYKSGHKVRRVEYQFKICEHLGEITAPQLIREDGKALQCTNCKSEYHRIRQTLEYEIWKTIRQRCFNPKCKAYKNYGGRGITLHPEWAESFEAFIRDVGWRPSPELTLDRIDNDGNYEPGNVRWATRKQQAYNTRRNRYITYKGQTKTLKEWAELAGTDCSHLIYHLKVRSEEDALRWFGL